MINFQTILAKISHKSFLEKRRFIYARHHWALKVSCITVSIDQKRPEHSIVHKDTEILGHLIIPMFMFSQQSSSCYQISFFLSDELMEMLESLTTISERHEKWADHCSMSHDKLQKRGVESYCQISFDLSWMNKSASLCPCFKKIIEIFLLPLQNQTSVTTVSD